MIHRMDPPADPDRQPLPSGDDLLPMTATAGDLPAGKGWRYEPWWPGRRLVVPFDGGRPIPPDGLRLPELAALGETLGSLAVVLDGVLVAIADDGRPDRGRLDRRLAATTATAARRLAGRVPLTFVVVDLLWIDGRSVTTLGLDERRGPARGSGGPRHGMGRDSPPRRRPGPVAGGWGYRVRRGDRQAGGEPVHTRADLTGLGRARRAPGSG